MIQILLHLFSDILLYSSSSQREPLLVCLLAGKEADQVTESYDPVQVPSMNPPTKSDTNVAELSTRHDNWFQLILKGCADAEQLVLVQRIGQIQFPKPLNGTYTHAQIAPFIASLHALFGTSATAHEHLNPDRQQHEAGPCNRTHQASVPLHRLQDRDCYPRGRGCLLLEAWLRPPEALQRLPQEGTPRAQEISYGGTEVDTPRVTGFV